MNVLFVCSGNEGEIKPFILEQANSLERLGIKVNFFVISGKGVLGYLKNLRLFKSELKSLNVELIHAHYGLSGLLSTLQRKVPVVITFHGSDINIWWVRLFSLLASRLASKSIFVSKKLANQLRVKNAEIIPCGVNTEKFTVLDKFIAREKLGLDNKKNIILFASRFDNKVKNYKLAKNATDLIGNNHKLIELKGYNREELNLLLNAADLLLLTSHSEGSPQIIKEAMACNCPIVATDVGDIKEVIANTNGCYLSSFDAEDVSTKIKNVLSMKSRTKGRENIMNLDNKLIAGRIVSVYKKILKTKPKHGHKN